MDNPGTMELPPMAQLARKMANIMGQLKRLNQAGQNAQGWTFTSIDDITDAIRALMAEHGIALFSKMLKATQTKEGKTTLATVDMEFELVCADTGASKVMSWTGSAEDYSDKAVNKAAVYAEKFWLKSTFLVSTGKDPDRTSPRLDKRNEQSRQQTQQRPPEPPQKPAQTVTTPVVVENRQPTPVPSVLKPWLDAEKKVALVAYAIQDKLLEDGDTWADFIKLGELKDDTDCLKFASGNDLYKHIKERAATLSKTATATTPKRYDMTVKNVIFTDENTVRIVTPQGNADMGRTWLIDMLTKGDVQKRHPGEKWVKKYQPETWTVKSAFGTAYPCADLTIEYLVNGNEIEVVRAWVDVKDDAPANPTPADNSDIPAAPLNPHYQRHVQTQPAP